MKQEVFCEIISTGSELMLGRLVDSNSAWLSSALAGLGLKVARHTSTGDDPGRLAQAFKRAWADHQVVVVTGGLGPTEDDLTREAAAEAFGLTLEFHEESAAALRAMLQARGHQLTDNNWRQARLPGGATLIPNAWGTAAGFCLEEAGRLMAFLPGVPLEMKRMTEAWLLPRLKAKFPAAAGLIKTVMIKTAGYGESLVDNLIGDMMRAGVNPKIGLLAGPNLVRVVVTAEGADEGEVSAVISPVLDELEKRLHGHVFGYGETTLAEATAALLKASGYCLAILDAISQGRLSGLISPSLERENWSGAQAMPWQPTLSGAVEILRLYAPDAICLQDNGDHIQARRRSKEIRLILTARPDPEAPPAAPGEVALTAESAIQCESLNGGRLMTRKFKVGGSAGLALSRAAALSNFHLWQVLAGFADE
ncbi:MAG: hypothetical protein LBS31_09170 [Candidatus Adiutrix sp.]|jgi:nicotinamide-nucleotide amidase|nr:hypothetical protein [Candidatus Adiutrix sp.]